MSSFGASAHGVLRGLLFLAILLFLPAWAKADDFGWSGDDSCSDPAIFSDIFTLPATNSHGGMCLAFGNHTGAPITSLKFTTTIPDANTDPMLCSAAPYFENCDYVLDTADNTLTIEFFGTDIDFPGIPVAPDCSLLSTNCLVPPNNFFINLNNPTCDLNGNNCTQPADINGTGDWLSGGGQPEVFSAVANGVPEPRSLALLLIGVGGLAAAIARRRRVRSAG